jgi:phosphotransacetylase
VPDETVLRNLQQLIERNHADTIRNYADNKEDIHELKDQLRDLALKVVSQDLFTKYATDWDRRFNEQKEHIAEERAARKADIKAVQDQMDKSSTGIRTNFWQGLTASILVVGTVVTIANLFLSVRGP